MRELRFDGYSGGRFRRLNSDEIGEGLRIHNPDELPFWGKSYGCSSWESIMEFIGPWSYCEARYFDWNESLSNASPKNGFYIRLSPEGEWIYPYFQDWLVRWRDGRVEHYALREFIDTVDREEGILVLEDHIAPLLLY
jgi:hypothetical protein